MWHIWALIPRCLWRICVPFAPSIPLQNKTQRQSQNRVVLSDDAFPDWQLPFPAADRLYPQAHSVCRTFLQPYSGCPAWWPSPPPLPPGSAAGGSSRFPVQSKHTVWLKRRHINWISWDLHRNCLKPSQGDKCQLTHKLWCSLCFGIYRGAQWA